MFMRMTSIQGKMAFFGFEVPDGHQPACTSAIIIAYCVIASITPTAGHKAGRKSPGTVGTALLRCGLVKLRVIDGHVMFHLAQLDDEGEVPHRKVHDEG